MITRGPKSVMVAHDNVLREFDVKAVEDIKDTTAAGDAFAGGFLAEFVLDKSLDVCVERGIWAAARVIKNIGCDFDDGDEAK